jgi:hypothetical protein
MTAVVAGAAVALSLLAGSYRRGALVGSTSASITAFVSLLWMQRGTRAKKPLNAALLVMVVMFLVRIVLVAFGTALVWHSGASIVAFIVAFFVPYFIFAAIEGWYLASLPRGTGPNA